MSDKKILTREEAKKVYPEKIWAIEDIYASDRLWEDDLVKLKGYSGKAVSYKGKLSNAENLFSYMKIQDELTYLISNLINYAQRKSDEDAGEGKYQDMCARLMSVLSDYFAAASFETPEIISIDEEKYQGLFKEKKELEVYRRYLDRVRTQKEHTLSEEAETVMALAGDVTQQADNIYNMFSNADLTFEDAVDSEKKRHVLTSGTYISLVQSKDRTLRKSAFENLYKSYKNFANTTAAILNSQIKSLVFKSKARKYNSNLEASLSATEVPVKVYKNLIETVHNNMKPMYEYVDLRKKILGVNELHMYDLYTPLIPDSDEKISYEEAVETVLKALEPLGEEYISILKKGFSERWIDVYENKGKCSGAYSAGAFCHPFVLLNYDENLESMFTIAHEMGHALHSYFSNKNQIPVNSEYVIFVAEVASTCNEALLMQYLLKNTEDKNKKAYLINYFLEQFRTTLYRQTMFAEFELKINEYCETGGGLTAEFLNSTYKELNKLYFGDGVVIDDEIQYEWSRIPHFYYDFYVFQYATGYSAAIALSQRILSGNTEMRDDYLKFLTEGCLYDPITLLRHAGVDMESKEPVEKALQLFAELVKELKELQ